MEPIELTKIAGDDNCRDGDCPTVYRRGPVELADVTELLVSELTTNAYKTTVEQDLRTPIALRLSSDRQRVLIEVWDGDASAPPAPSPQPPVAIR